MKSMKEIADELNVTKMTVYNNAKKANVKFQKIDNVNYLSGEDETIVVNRIRKNQNKNDDFEGEKKEEAEPNNDNLVKDETIKQLYNQVAIYKEQSNRDKEQINTLNRLLENQQILALESNKKIQKLENQLEEERHLNYSFNASSNNQQKFNTQSETFNKDFKDINKYEDKPIDIKYKNMLEEKQREHINKEVPKTNERYGNKKEQNHKKGFWSRLFGN